MTQTVLTKAVKVETCATCPYFNNFHEPEKVEVDGNSLPNPRYGCGWCELFNHQAREHHEITNDCINSSKPVISHNLEDNLALFPEVDLEESEDELDKPRGEYEVGSVVKVIDVEEDYTEWGVFEVIECSYNKYIYDKNNPEAYLNHVDWYYRLASNNDSTSISKSLWVAENEICSLDMAHNVCTKEVF